MRRGQLKLESGALNLPAATVAAEEIDPDVSAKAIEHLHTYLKENPTSPQTDSVHGAIKKLRRKY